MCQRENVYERGDMEIINSAQRGVQSLTKTQTAEDHHLDILTMSLTGLSAVSLRFIQVSLMTRADRCVSSKQATLEHMERLFLLLPSQ